MENQHSHVQRELFARVKREGFNRKCPLVVLIAAGAGANQEEAFLYDELCVNRSSAI